MGLVERIIAAGERKADEVEVYCMRGTSVTARLQKREVHYASGSRHCSLSVRVISGGSIGTSSTSNPEDWEGCLDAAVQSARLASAQPWGGLPGPAGLDPAPLNFDPGLTPDPNTARGLLGEMLDGASVHPVEVTSGSAELSVYSISLSNSHGLSYSTVGSLASIGMETIIDQSTGYEFDNAWRLADLDPRSVGEKAASLAASSRGGSGIETGDYEVVLSPLALAQLLGVALVPGLNGRNVHAGRSRLAGQEGRQVIDRSLSIIDDPWHPRGLGSTWWDAEGTPTGELVFIRDGTLEQFAYDLKTAFRYGKESTGSAVRSGSAGGPSIGTHNIRLEGPRTALLDDPAVYVHDIVGAHTANPLTGDFSVELTNAFLARGGSFERPVRKALLSGNVFSMLADIGGLGKEERVIGSFILPEIQLKRQRIIGT